MIAFHSLRIGLLATISITMLSLYACRPRPKFSSAEVDSSRNALSDFNQAAASFSVDDGIDHSEAQLLVGAFVSGHWGCGSAGALEDGGTSWRAHPGLGYAGHPAKDFIRVDKQTGAVSYAFEPPVAAQSVIEHERERLRDDVRWHVGKRVDGQ